MSKLTYVTRGQSSPQGKLKVYLCMHPREVEKYRETLSREVLSEYDCAVWYDAMPEQPSDAEELKAALREMTLFIMPVTTRLLTTENRALQVEFRLAQEHHIPVLPLLQEQGLEELFNRKCGNLQALNREADAADSTGLSYEEKYKKFLAGVLMSDDSVANVRTAFDAYIFLSYRKKDRIRAQELMRLIHKNDFCRDIAIWYDEFLNPGENFNDAIAKAMEKSELFALVVTPNLINEENYVQSVEYPSACRTGKKILPVLMEDTDSEELRRQYEGISTPVSSQDESMLARQLRKSFERISLREKSGDARHEFFIGLAYLNGIDVERSVELGCRLITRAAKLGLTQAAEKLVAMYENGDGVKRDYGEMLRWSEALCRQSRNEWERTGADEDAQVWFRRSIEHVDRLIRYTADHEKAWDVCLPLRGFAEEREQETQAVVWRRNAGIYYDTSARILEKRGRLEEALAYYRSSLATYRVLREETQSLESRRDEGTDLGRVGGILEKMGRLEEAMEHYRGSLEIRRALREETQSAQSRREESFGLEQVGRILEALGRREEAQEYYRRSREIVLWEEER